MFIFYSSGVLTAILINLLRLAMGLSEITSQKLRNLNKVGVYLNILNGSIVNKRPSRFHCGIGKVCKR